MNRPIPVDCVIILIKEDENIQYTLDKLADAGLDPTDRALGLPIRIVRETSNAILSIICEISKSNFENSLVIQCQTQWPTDEFVKNLNELFKNDQLPDFDLLVLSVKEKQYSNRGQNMPISWKLLSSINGKTEIAKIGPRFETLKLATNLDCFIITRKGAKKLCTQFLKRKPINHLDILLTFSRLPKSFVIQPHLYQTNRSTPPILLLLSLILLLSIYTIIWNFN